MIKRLTLASLTTLARVVAWCGPPTASAVAHQTSTRTTTIARRRRQRWTARLVTALLLVATGSLVSPPASYAAGPKLTAMTRNLYLGTALDNAVAASNFAEFVQTVSQDWAHVVAMDFPTRARALAAEILRAKPDVVGLQEVSLWRDQAVSDIVTGTTVPNATHVVYDFLAIVQAELTAGGTPYYGGVDVDQRRYRGPPIELGIAERIHRRADDRPRRHSGSHRAGRQVQRSGERSLHGTSSLSRRLSGPSPSPGAGHRSTIGTTRTAPSRSLAPTWKPSPGRQARRRLLQGEELLGQVAGSPNAVVLADINSAADGSQTPTYANLTKELDDAWSVKGQRPRSVVLYERIAG